MFKEQLKAAQDRLTKLRKGRAKAYVVTDGSHVVVYIKESV